MSTKLKPKLEEDVSHLVPDLSGSGRRHEPAPVGPFERCVYYCRFSTDLQNESSIERQVDFHDVYAKVNGLVPRLEGHIFADRGLSGAWLEGREALAQVLALARAHAFDKLLVEDLDRLSRDVLHVIQIHRELKKLGIEIHVTGNGTGRVDDVQAVFFGLFGMMARTRILQVTAAGRWRAAEKGRNVGGVPYGYRPGPERGTLVVYEPEAAIVRLIFEWADKGLSARKIAHALNQMDVPSPFGVEWTPSTILGSPSDGSGILRNPKYVGIYVFGKRRTTTTGDGTTKTKSNTIRPKEDWVILLMPEWQIVERRLFVRVMNRLKLAAQKKAAAKETAEGAEPTEKDSKLTSLVFHGKYFCECGSRMVGAFDGRSKTRNLFCRAARYQGTCEKKQQISCNPVEIEILREIRDGILCPQALKVFVQEYVLDAQRAEEETQARKERLVRQIGELDALIKGSIRDSILSTSDPRDLDQLREMWTAERLLLEDTLSALPPLRIVPQVDPKSIVSLKEQIDALILRMPFHEETVDDMLLVAALRSLVLKVVVRSERGGGPYGLSISATLAGLTDDTTAALEAGVPVRVLERSCPKAPQGRANAAEREEHFRRLASSKRFALTDAEWSIAEPVMKTSSRHPGRLLIDAGLFYLRTDASFTTLPPPFDVNGLAEALRFFVKQGGWRTVYEALVEADCPSVAALDTGAFDRLEKKFASRKPARREKPRVIEHHPN